eukprot:s1592_g5.t1
MLRTEAMVESESIKKAEGVLEKAPSGDACQIQDLEPATCPPGSDRLEDLKRQAENGQEQCQQKAAAAKVTLRILDTKAKEIDAAALALNKEKHLSSQLEELKKVTDKTAEVVGHAHQVKGMDEVLEAAGVSSSLSKASKEEEYEKLSKQLIKKYFQTLNEVSLELILQNGLPMELDKIAAILDECDAVHQIGETAGQGRKEVQKINDDLKKHLDARLQQALVSVQEQQKLCKKRRKDADENEKTCLAKVEKALEILTGELGKHMDAVITKEAQIMMQTELQTKEQAILDEINRAKDISPEAAAALASCTNQAVECKKEIDKITKERFCHRPETAAGLKETAQLPATLAMEGTEVALNILLRAEDQKKKQIQVTEKELRESWQHSSEAKPNDPNVSQDLLSVKQDESSTSSLRTALAQTMSEVEDRRKSLQQQKEELCKVQEIKGKAEFQYESLRWLENVNFPFDKPAISPRSKVKENAGDFEMFQVPQETQEAELAAPQVGAPGPESYALSNLRRHLRSIWWLQPSSASNQKLNRHRALCTWITSPGSPNFQVLQVPELDAQDLQRTRARTEVHSLIQKIVEEELQEKWTIQARLYTFDIL